MKFGSFEEFDQAVEDGEIDIDEVEITVDNDSVWIWLKDSERSVEVEGISHRHPANVLVRLFKSMGYDSRRP